MPKHVMHLIDDMLENGSDPDIKVLGAGLKETLSMLDEMGRYNRTMYKLIDDHVKDKSKHLSAEGGCPAMVHHITNKDLHTPKGILVRTKVIAWFVGIVIFISSIVSYAPELVSKIPGLP